MPPSRLIRISPAARTIMMDFAQSSPSQEVIGVMLDLKLIFFQFLFYH